MNILAERNRDSVGREKCILDTEIMIKRTLKRLPGRCHFRIYDMGILTSYLKLRSNSLVSIVQISLLTPCQRTL